MHPDASSTQIQLTSSICTAFAIATTLLRLFIRRKNPWVDDLCAIFSMCFLTTQMGVILQSRGHIDSFIRSYLVMIMFYATVWSARTAILFTVIRIGRGRRLIRPLSAVVVIFTLLWAVLTGQLFWTCEMQRRRSPAPISSCTPTRQIAILQLIADIFADLTLLVSSLQLFRVIQDSSLRHRLKFIFSTCMATTLASIVHASFILKGKDSTMTLIAALVEGCVSLIVSSLPVVTTLFFHLKPTLFHNRLTTHSASPGIHYQSSLLASLEFAPSPEAISIYDCVTLTPPEAKSTDFVRTASDLEYFCNADLPRIQTGGIAQPQAVHVHLPISPY